LALSLPVTKRPIRGTKHSSVIAPLHQLIKSRRTAGNEQRTHQSAEKPEALVAEC
jgi:hypothetical protein